jgi:hypothetical protein
MIQNGSLWITPIHMIYNKTIPTIPYHTIPHHLVKRGSQTTCNCKHDYHDSCTLCKLSALYPRVVISSMAERLENLIFAILYTSFGVWPRDHYMPGFAKVACSTIALLRFPGVARPLLHRVSLDE